VYEDERVLAFLDIAPLSRGHTLLIPKEAAISLHDLSEESGAALGVALIKVATAVMKTTGASDYNVLQNNGTHAHQAVSYVHFHIIPKYADGDGLSIDWKPQELTDGESLAQDIRSSLTM